MKNDFAPSVKDELMKPKQLIKPLKIEQMIQDEKSVEALCESRDSCNWVNSGIGSDDGIIF